MTDEQATDGTRLSYSYDEHNNIQSYTAKKNGTTLSTASYTYTDEGLPVTATVGGENGTQFSYEYDSLNRLQSLSFEAENNNIIETEYYYAPGTDGQTTGVVDQVNYYIRFYEGSGYYSTYPLQASYGYTYDQNGNITLIENNWGDRSYEYDKLNRLVRENDELLDQTVVYTYDNGGNILTKTYYDYTTDELGTVKDTVTYTYDSVWKDKLLTYDGGTTITYDEIGNPLTYNGYTFTWQKGRQLASASGNGYTITYKYGADGLRTEKTVNGVTTKYTYVSGLLAAQTDGTNTLQFYYAPDDTCLAVKYNGTMYYYIYNLQGDVVKITNASGSTIVEYKYDTWGKVIAVTGSLGSTLGRLNPFRYRGYVYDTETGFYYLTTRYYDPATGRFLNADGYISTGYAIAGFNMFAYCLNNPVMCEDSGGNRPVVGDWPNETEKELQASFDYMNGRTTTKDSTPESIDSEYTFIDFLTDYNQSFIDLINVLDDALYVEGGFGIGVGASGNIGLLDIGAHIYFNPINIKMTTSECYFYSSFYVGVPASIGAYEENIEWHYQIKWSDIAAGDIFAWEDVSNPGGIKDFGIGETFYSPTNYFFGETFFIGFDQEKLMQ